MTTDPLPVQLARLLGWSDLTPHETWDEDRLCRWWTGRPAPGEPACPVPPYDTWEDVGRLIETAHRKGYDITIGPFHRDRWEARLRDGQDGLGGFVAGTAAEAVGLAFVAGLGGKETDRC